MGLFEVDRRWRHRQTRSSVLGGAPWGGRGSLSDDLQRKRFGRGCCMGGDTRRAGIREPVVGCIQDEQSDATGRTKVSVSWYLGRWPHRCGWVRMIAVLVHLDVLYLYQVEHFFVMHVLNNLPFWAIHLEHCSQLSVTSSEPAERIEQMRVHTTASPDFLVDEVVDDSCNGDMVSPSDIDHPLQPAFKTCLRVGDPRWRHSPGRGRHYVRPLEFAFFGGKVDRGQFKLASQFHGYEIDDEFTRLDDIQVSVRISFHADHDTWWVVADCIEI